MDKMFPFKEIARIGKSLLVQMAGVSQNYKKEMYVEEIDYDSCPDICPFVKFDVEQKHQICMNHCPHKPKMKTPKVVYINERHKYNIKTEINVEDYRLSKYQILQLLAYHFFNIDSNGFIPFVSAKELSKKVGCTVRTIKNNNIRLSQLGLISFTRYNSDLFGVTIHGYDKNHLTKKQGGTGYIQMPKSLLDILSQIDNVNSIRFALRQLISHEDDIELRQKQEATLSYNDIKRFMPSNINHKKIIDKLIIKNENIFDIDITDTQIYFKLKDEFNGKIIKPQKEQQFKEELTQYIKDKKEPMFEVEIEELALLAMEYGIDFVKESIVIYINYKQSTDFVENIGGFIRTVIVNNFIKKRVA